MRYTFFLLVVVVVWALTLVWADNKFHHEPTQWEMKMYTDYCNLSGGMTMVDVLKDGHVQVVCIK